MYLCRWFLRVVVGIVLLCGAVLAHATQLQFIGTGNYSASAGRVTITFAQLKNIDTNRSGTLYLRLVAVPVDATVLSTQVLAEGTFLELLGSNYGTLEPGASFTNISLITNYTAPPAGSYNVYLKAYEYPLTTIERASVAAVGNPKTFTAPVGSGTGGSTGTGSGGSTGGASGAGALDLVCDCSYSTSADYVNLKAVRVQNNTGRTSGTLRLKLWATAQPYSGGDIAGYELATYTFADVLQNGTYFTNIDLSVPYEEPSEGTWYLTMTLTEYNNGQDYVMDYTTFAKTLTITINGNAGGTNGGPTAASIDLLCDCSYETSGTTLTLNAFRVENNAGRSTGTLRLQLWASSQPYSGSSISGYKMGEYTLGTLANNEYFYSINQYVTYTAPPAGTYYVTMMLTENDLQVDYTRFDKTITVSGSTTSTKPLDLVCSCGYAISGSNVALTASRVLNQAGRTSGTLRLRLYATAQPYSGGTLTGYKLAEYTFTQVLTNNQYYNTVNVTVPYTAPGPGTWYYTLALVESSSGDTLRDYSSFTTPVVIAEPTPTGSSTAPWILSPSGGYNAASLPARTEHYYKIVVTQTGTLTLETSGSLDTVGRLALGSTLVTTGDSGGAGNNMKISTSVTAGTYVLQLYEYYGTSGFYSIQSTFTAASSSTSTQPTVYASAGIRHPNVASTAVFGAGVSTDNGVSFSKTARRQDTVVVSGKIEAESQHRGRSADIYLVERINGVFYMKNTSDALVPWNGSISTLVPFRTGVTLSTANQFTLMTGTFSTLGDHSFFIGYKVSGEDLRYNSSAVRITVTD